MDRLVSFPCLEPQEALPTIVFVCNIEDAETFAVLLLFGCETLSVLLLFGWYIDLSTERLSLFFYFLGARILQQDTETLTVQCSSTCWVVNRSINRETLDVDFKLKFVSLFGCLL